MNSRFALRKVGTFTANGTDYTKVTGNTFPVKDDIKTLGGGFLEKRSANEFVYAIPTIALADLFATHKAKVGMAKASDNQLLTVCELVNNGALSQADVDAAFAKAAGKGRDHLTFGEASDLITNGRAVAAILQTNAPSVEKDEALTETAQAERNLENFRAE